MVKIQQKGEQFFVTIPRDTAEQVKLKKGEKVTISPDQFDKDMIIKRRR